MSSIDKFFEAFEHAMSSSGLVALDVPELGSKDGAELSISVSAFSGGGIRFARAIAFETPKFVNLNFIAFPEFDLEAPILGAEWMIRSEDVVMYATDLWGRQNSSFDPLLVKTQDNLGVEPTPKDDRILSMLSPDAVYFRGADCLSVDEATRVTFSSFADYFSRLQEVGERDSTASQLTVVEHQRRKPGAEAFLAGAFEPAEASRFLETVMYPMGTS